MNKDFLWAYYIMLGTNMWNEKGVETFADPWQDHFATDEATWKAVIDYLPECGFNAVLIDIGDAIEYESHPEISIPGAWSKEKTKKELDRIRSLGLTPIPKLNFSAMHDAWLKEYSYMVSTPEYYRVVEDLIREVAELFGYPKLFHLGMDEEFCTDPAPKNMMIIRPKRIWYHDLNFMFNVCDKVGARPWIWADAAWNDPEDYVKHMSKDTVQSNWYYGALRKNPDGSYVKKEVETYRILEKAGFDQIPTSSTISRWQNVGMTMEMGKEVIAPERLKGFLTASWYFTFPRHLHGMMNEALIFKYAKRENFPEA